VTLQEDFNVQFMRGYLQRMDDAIIGDGQVVTDDDAREALARIRAEEEFETGMLAFIAQVANRPAGDWRVVMSSEQRAFVRWLHQRQQRLRIYAGGRSPALYGCPIVIDDTATAPRLEAP
jgi:hypothetical protein